MAEAGLKEIVAHIGGKTIRTCVLCGGFFREQDTSCGCCGHLSASEKRSLHLLWTISRQLERQTEILESLARVKLNETA